MNTLKTIIISGLCAAALSAGAVPLQLLSTIDASIAPSASAGGDSSQPVISPDGRFVLFASTANNLATVSSNTPFRAPVYTSLNVFLRDRASNTTVLVSVNLAGTAGADRDCVPVAISTNGQYALFESVADNLVAGDTNNASDVFVRDLVNSNTILVSVNTNGVAGNSDSYDAVMTPDGRYVAFTSAATDLVAGDTNGIPDVFARDLQGGTTSRVSLGAMSNGSISPMNTSDAAAITPDGRYVAFYSSATNLVPGLKLSGEIYLRDRVAGTTIWASTNARTLYQSVTGSTNAVSCNLKLSDDGQYIAFEACSNAPAAATALRGIVLRYNVGSGLTDLIYTNTYVPLSPFDTIQDLALTPDGRFVAYVADITNSLGINTAIYLWDAQSGGSTLVSADTNNALPTIGFCDLPRVSSNGLYVAFYSTAAGLATNVSSSALNLYLRNVSLGTTTLVNADTNGVSTGGGSMQSLQISADGHSVAFESVQPGLTINDLNHDSDVFLWNADSGAMELVSVRNPNLPSVTADGLNTYSSQAVSADGRWLAFSSEADNLVPGDTNQLRDVFVRDLYMGTNVLVSVGTGGASAAGISFEPAVSGSGRYVAFTSAATNLIAVDTNNATDIFVRDLQGGTNSLVSVDLVGRGQGNADTFSPVLSADGRFVLFLSKAANLAAGTFSGTNLFLRDRQGAVTYALTTSGEACFAMTPDGHFIAFTDTAGASAGKIYLWDALQAKRILTNTTTATIQAVALSPDGNRLARVAGSATLTLSVYDQALNTSWSVGTGSFGTRAGLRFSANGNFLCYASSPATAGATNQVYEYSIPSQTSVLVSHIAGGSTAADAASDSPDVSADGRFVAYRSSADNLVAGDTNGVPDIFLFDATTGSNIVLSAGSNGNVSADNRSLAPLFSTDGHTLVFRSWGTDLTTGDFNQTADLFAYAFLYANFSVTFGGNPALDWPVTPGQTFTVEYKDDLADPVWHTASDAMVIVGNRGYYSDTTPLPGHRFYHVVANP